MKMDMKSIKILCIILVGLLPFTLAGQENVKIVAQGGDGVNSVLRRYQLLNSHCNVAHFYQLNALKWQQPLQRKQVYQLPVFVYEYNGQSIRSTLGLNNHTRAKKIEDYNTAMRKAKLKKGNYKKTKVLWVPYHLLVCPQRGELNGAAKRRTFPIFGKKYAKVPLVSTKLKGKIYYIVAGHGGPDPGAINRSKGRKICEDEYAYDVALRLTRHLIQHGAIAYVIVRDPNDGIRDGRILKADKDEVCWKDLAIPLSAKTRLFQRSNTINKLYDYYKFKGFKEQYTVMLHIDARQRKKRIDVYFYHFPGSKGGKKLAYKLQKTFRAKYAKYQKGRGYNGAVKTRDLHMLRETKPPSVYIELGNLKNESDLQRFLIKRNRELVAKWLFEGLTS